MATAKVGQVAPVVGQGLLARAFASGAQAGAQAASNYTEGMGAIMRDRTQRAEIASRMRIAQMQTAAEMNRANMQAQLSREEMQLKDRLASAELKDRAEDRSLRQAERIDVREENRLQREFELTKLTKADELRQSLPTERLAADRLDWMNRYSDTLGLDGKPTESSVGVVQEGIASGYVTPETLYLLSGSAATAEPIQINGQQDPLQALGNLGVPQIMRANPGMSAQQANAISRTIRNYPAAVGNLQELQLKLLAAANLSEPEDQLRLTFIKENAEMRAGIASTLTGIGVPPAAANNYAYSLLPKAAWEKTPQEVEQEALASAVEAGRIQEATRLRGKGTLASDYMELRGPGWQRNAGRVPSAFEVWELAPSEVAGPYAPSYMMNGIGRLTEPRISVSPRTQPGTLEDAQDNSGVNSAYTNTQ